jgi:hypothetical protein
MGAACSLPPQEAATAARSRGSVVLRLDCGGAGADRRQCNPRSERWCGGIGVQVMLGVQRRLRVGTRSGCV